MNRFICIQNLVSQRKEAIANSYINVDIITSFTWDGRYIYIHFRGEDDDRMYLFASEESAGIEAQHLIEQLNIVGGTRGGMANDT